VGFSNLFAELQGSSLRQHMPRASAVPFTTITMNKRYAARLHRDSRNDGPSIGNAVGKFSGGKLLYWRRFLLRNVRGSAGGSCKQEATSFHAESADHRDNVRQQTEDLWHLVKERAALEGTSVQGACDAMRYHTIVQHCDAIRYHLILYYNMMAGLKDAAMAAGEMQPWRLARHESLGQWRSHAGELPLVRLVKLALQRRFQSQQGASV
jgi:hypothetical protein